MTGLRSFYIGRSHYITHTPHPAPPPAHFPQRAHTERYNDIFEVFFPVANLTINVRTDIRGQVVVCTLLFLTAFCHLNTPKNLNRPLHTEFYANNLPLYLVLPTVETLFYLSIIYLSRILCLSFVLSYSCHPVIFAELTIYLSRILCLSFVLSYSCHPVIFAER